MAEKTILKKQAKKNKLVGSAYALFTDKGIFKTTIDDIVKKAGVAKGTFYLYFKDKDDILSEVIYGISIEILTQASQYVQKNVQPAFEDNVILFANYIIDFFSEHQALLKMIRKNFCWPMVQERIKDESDTSVLHHLLEDCKKAEAMQKYSEEEMFRIIFIIVEMCGSICYDCIINEEPDNINNMKPTLFHVIRKIIA